jgi:hypothetical protein
MHDLAAPTGAGTETGRDAEADLLRRFLLGRDVACPGCGYNLRDLTGGRCPECGQEIVLHLQLAEPRQAALLTGLIGLAAGVGLNGLLVIYYLIIRFLARFPGPPDDSFLVTILTGLAIHGVAMALWLRFWRRIRLMAPRRRWALAVACCVMPLVDIVIFSVSIR